MPTGRVRSARRWEAAGAASHSVRFGVCRPFPGALCSVLPCTRLHYCTVLSLTCRLTVGDWSWTVQPRVLIPGVLFSVPSIPWAAFLIRRGFQVGSNGCLFYPRKENAKNPLQHVHFHHLSRFSKRVVCWKRYVTFLHS